MGFGLAHVLFGMTILFGCLHPIRDLLDDQAFELCRGMATIEVLNGLGLMILSQSGRFDRPATLIASGTLVSAAMAYWIAFSGTHPLDAIVPLGGLMMLAGWIWALFRYKS